MVAVLLANARTRCENTQTILFGAPHMRKQLFLVAAALVSSVLPANSQSLVEIQLFAQSICGDIPEGRLTRTEIEGKIQANVGAFARLLGASGELSASQKDEVYKGIPLDKLPSNIPTVSMCKSELAKVLVGKRVDINTCRHADFGQEGWKYSEVYTNSSGRVGGGRDQRWWCNEVGNSFIKARSIGPQHKIEFIKSDEESDKDMLGHVTYKYHCTVKVQWEPLYFEKKDARCGVTKVQ